MKKKIVKIIIGFENCENVDINEEDIELSATGITQDIYTRWYNDDTFNELLKSSAKSVIFNIKNFRKYKPVSSNNINYLFISNNIVDFTIHFDDNSNFKCYVPWDEKGEYTNHYQSNIYDENKDLLHIIICKKHKKIKKNYEKTIMAG